MNENDIIPQWTYGLFGGVSGKNRITKTASIIYFLIFFGSSSFSQTTITGVVKDKDTNEKLPYVNIGIRHKDIGTSSSTDGSFLIQIPAEDIDDTLTFSMVGYNSLNLPISKILFDNQHEFILKMKSTQLNTLVVSENKLVEKDFGITANQLLKFGDGSVNYNDIIEIAQLVKLDTTPSRVTSINLYINEGRRDSGTFRINFYGYDGLRPTERILEKSIIQTKVIKDGWLKFDLRKYDIIMKGQFVASIEILPSEKKTYPIYYGLKLGGSARSFVRTSSQGEWNVPPHHYRMYITALVNGKNKRKNDLENRESIPSVALYSLSVKDSFSIFISLPENYGKNKSEKYSVIYLLDANLFFDVVADQMRSKNTDAILVGIGYKDFVFMDSLRDRDYTYPKADPKFEFKISGGADKYLSFIKDELFPYINKNYRTDSSEASLFGHSLGGYFVMYALTKSIQNNYPIFKNYVAASPSLHYSDYISKQFENISGDITINQALLITYGEREDLEDMEEGEVSTNSMNTFNTFVSLLSNKKYSNIKLKSKVFSKFGHMETAIPSFEEGLKLIK